MERLCAIFPVVSGIILNNLDDQSWTNLKVASKDLNYLLDKEKCIPLRKIKKTLISAQNRGIKLSKEPMLTMSRY